MTDKVKIIPKGAVFSVTAGVYSGYYTLALCKALTEIDIKAMQEEYLSERPEQNKKHRLKEREVIAWIVNEKRYAEEIDFCELHLGDYSTADFMLSIDSDF